VMYAVLGCLFISMSGLSLCTLLHGDGTRVEGWRLSNMRLVHGYVTPQLPRSRKLYSGCGAILGLLDATESAVCMPAIILMYCM
jgi:hypothetical protein